MVRNQRKGTGQGRAARRGIALLLVLIFVGVAVVLGGVLVTSEQTGTAAGQNALASVQAEWAAESAGALAVASFEAGVASDANAGALMNAVAVGGASADVTVTNMRGGTPTADDRELIVRAVAMSNGISVEAVRHVTVPVPIADASDAVDPLLDEFAVFAAEEYSWRIGASMGVWGLDPQARLTRWVNLGFGFADLSAISFSGAAVSNHALYRDSSSSALLDLAAPMIDLLGRGYKVDCEIPALSARLPGAVTSLSPAGIALTSVGGVSDRSVPSAQRFLDLTCATDGIIRFRPVASDSTFAVDDFSVSSDGMVEFAGDITLHVAGDLIVQNGGMLTLRDDASRVTIYLGGALIVDAGYIGIPESLARSGRGIASLTDYIDPRRVRIIQVAEVDGGDSTPNWWLHRGSQVVACLAGPRARFQLDDSHLAGRVTASRVDLMSGGKLLYPPSLNRCVGFTSPKGPLFAAPGEVVSTVAAVLDAADPAQGLQGLNASLRGLTMSNGERVASRTVDQEAADMEERKSLAEADALVVD